jgi:hypothetical protein
LLVAYVVDGPFGDRLRRVTFDRVRRLVDEDGWGPPPET